MFWGCVAFTVLGDLVPVDGNMNQIKYLDVLNNNDDELIGESFILQQDNAPCYKTKLITVSEKCLHKNIGLATSNSSPHLNRIPLV